MNGMRGRKSIISKGKAGEGEKWESSESCPASCLLFAAEASLGLGFIASRNISNRSLSS